ncbi:hypothetical protein ABID26_002669 [Mesorhizobium shonense]|uniref:Uncharacterized protein n=1 Tax=Mesorhizobium shonense TaxID=1209948 RepID=A0ABV2HT02_9HYPH
MIMAPKQEGDYADREIDCQEAMEPGFQAILDCMLDAGWQRGEVDAGVTASDRRRQHDAEGKRQG